jgi:uncharacterized protein YjiS (DUF1127 family)
MNREIKIIKRAVRDLRQMEREQTVLSHVCNKPEVASPLQLARTIEEWVRMHRQRASEELLAAQSLRAAF